MTDLKRYSVLDFLRGFALINMILYHGLWDATHIFGTRIPWFTSQTGFIWQQCICHTFILLSGFCWHLGRKKLKRGLIVLAASVIISAVTSTMMPDNIILFGVLSLIGSGMLIMIPLDRVFKKINPYLGFVICFCIFTVTRTAATGVLQIGELKLLTLPDAWYSNLFTAYLGFPGDDFISQDYFPLVPWLFLYQEGYFLYRIFKKRNLLKYLSRSVSRPLEWLGRHSLIIYMLHQPIIYVVLTLVYSWI